MSYCTYLTIYKGNKMPPFYIGSTSVKRVKDGYCGSVKSAKYKEVWNTETKNNPNLFETKIISTHTNRKDALLKENELHKKLNVVSNNLYINMAIASGCFGNMSKESIEKMTQTKRVNGKIVGQKVSKTRNDPIWKATVGKIASERLSQTTSDPKWKATMGLKRKESRKNTTSSIEWQQTTGLEWRKKISSRIKEMMAQLEWKEKETKRKESFYNTINSKEFQEKLPEINRKRSETVSKIKSNPEWKEKHRKICSICNKAFFCNVISRHMKKCQKENS